MKLEKKGLKEEIRKLNLKVARLTTQEELEDKQEEVTKVNFTSILRSFCQKWQDQIHWSGMLRSA
jgi:predicted DNA-binding ribbon-helix-helix protein